MYGRGEARTPAILFQLHAPNLLSLGPGGIYSLPLFVFLSLVLESFDTAKDTKKKTGSVSGENEKHKNARTQ